MIIRVLDVGWLAACSGAPYPLQHWSHRTLDAGGKYTFRSDLRMLAEQLLCWVELDEGGRDLRQQVRACVPDLLALASAFHTHRDRE